MRHKRFITVVLLAGALCAPAFGISTVSAHATLQGQTPAANSNLKKAPASVSLLAGEQGIGSASSDYVAVFDGQGVNHAGSLSVTPRENSSLITTPVSSMSKGWYAVHWNVSSEDGHQMGGDTGAWWAFGVNGTTTKSSKLMLVARNVMPPAGTKPTMNASVSGNRKGNQTVTVVNKWGTVYSVKWVLNDPARESLNGATFTWFATCKKKTFTCTATGVLPFVGKYDATFQVISSSSTGSSTAFWTSQLTIK